MNEDAKEFLKLWAISVGPPFLMIVLLLIVVTMWGYSPSHDLGYVIEDQNGVQVVCKRYWMHRCGLRADDCDNSAEIACMHNAKIRKVEP